jgi:hypothetical protein
MYIGCVQFRPTSIQQIIQAARLACETDEACVVEILLEGGAIRPRPWIESPSRDARLSGRIRRQAICGCFPEKIRFDRKIGYRDP